MISLYQTLIETTPMTEEHKIILKPEIPQMSWVVSKNHCKGKSCA